MKKSGADGASQTAGGHPASPATSAKSSAGTTVGDQAAGGECAGSASRPESAEAQVGGAGMGTGREGNAGDGSRGGGKLSEERGLLVHAASSIALGELRMSTILGSTNGGGLKRVRDRRADRRRKRDPFEALEERLLDAFSPESILRQLERQDETLLKGVRAFVCHCTWLHASIVKRPASLIRELSPSITGNIFSRVVCETCT